VLERNYSRKFHLNKDFRGFKKPNEKYSKEIAFHFML
jgi:hypothetical protein